LLRRLQYPLKRNPLKKAGSKKKELQDEP